MYDAPGVTPHGLPHDPFKSCVAPRPIGWISTVDRKDSVLNAEESGEFVWNMATCALREAVNKSAEELPHGVDELNMRPNQAAFALGQVLAGLEGSASHPALNVQQTL